MQLLYCYFKLPGFRVSFKIREEPVLLIMITAARNGPTLKHMMVIRRFIISLLPPGESVMEIRRKVKINPVASPRKVIVGSASIPVKMIYVSVVE